MFGVGSKIPTSESRKGIRTSSISTEASLPILARSGRQTALDTTLCGAPETTPPRQVMIPADVGVVLN